MPRCFYTLALDRGSDLVWRWQVARMFVGPRFARRIISMTAAVSVATVSLLLATASGARGDAVSGVDYSCVAPAGNPTNPVSAEWIQRDTENQRCATLKVRDQLENPAFAYLMNALKVGDTLYLYEQQVSDGPDHLHSPVILIPGSNIGDPFRYPALWESATGGTATPVAFTSLNGNQLRGTVWMPPPSVPKPAGGYPGVVITEGAAAPAALFYWAAEGLAQYGYMVLTFDVGGQGQSDSDAGGTIQSTEDALNYFLSTPSQPHYGASGVQSLYNPYWQSLDASKIGQAGHSGGSIAGSWVGQCDSRVKTIVAWDDLLVVTPSQCAANVTVPAAYQATALHAPGLAITPDYFLTTQPQTTVPDPHSGGLRGDTGYQQLVAAGLDSMKVAQRGSTHSEYSYATYVLPSSELGERFAFYYTLAWFDQYLKGNQNLLPGQTSGYNRLVFGGTYDGSADYNAYGTVSIGQGTYDAALAAANPQDLIAGNVPYLIDGISICDTLSFYYWSQYTLHATPEVVVTSSDIRADCPALDVDGDGVNDLADNCPFVDNPDQLDSGGINTTVPDGIGDACQCGDVTGNGIVNGQDGNVIKRHGLRIEPNDTFVVPGNCDVTGNGLCNGQDANATQREALGLESPAFGQNCHNAIGLPVPPGL
jgi:hypothetical protein